MISKQHLITRLLAFGLAAAMLISDQAVLYAAEAGTLLEDSSLPEITGSFVFYGRAAF